MKKAFSRIWAFRDRIVEISGFCFSVFQLFSLSVFEVLSRCLEAVAQGVVIAALESAFLALAFTGFDEVLQAAGPLGSRFAAFGTAAFPLFAQLVLALTGDG